MTQDEKQWHSPRTIVLCFDGTGNLYDDTNTNVVKLFSMLKKDNKDEQLVYYQAGIGTYPGPGIVGGLQRWATKRLDQAIAWYLSAHVMGGYQFLMQNYRAGDRVCLFGFCRGAYTARALAGMLYKVGLLPRDNTEQIKFAYNMYKCTGEKNRKLAAGFKQTFCRSVQIEFIGCWDTVSSVGMFWGRHLPFASSNASIKRFRHALSLDERRVKFQPNFWHREAPDDSSAREEPEHGSRHPNNKGKSFDSKRSDSSTNQPASTTDVLEVWFAGSHDDVGGGMVSSDKQCSLSNISLRWMVREVVVSQCGIQFEGAALERAGVFPSRLATDESAMLHMLSATEVSEKDDGKEGASTSWTNALTVEERAAKVRDDARDAVQPLHDALKRKAAPIWWAHEVIPTSVSWQDDTGAWRRGVRWNFGRGRTMDVARPKIHSSVQTRMADAKLGYVPRAKWTDKPEATWVS